MVERPESGTPPCADECAAVLRAEWAETCRAQGSPVIDVHITHVAPLVPTLYPDLQMSCPHGVVWHMQPTSEQMVEWAEKGVA